MKSNGNPTADSADYLWVDIGQKQGGYIPSRYRYRISFWLLMFLGIYGGFSGCTHTGHHSMSAGTGDNSGEYIQSTDKNGSVVFLPVDPGIHAPVIAEPPPLEMQAVESKVPDLKSNIYIPSEDTSGDQVGVGGDLRSKIYVPSEQASNPEPLDLRSRIFVPSEQPVETESLRSKIYVPSEAE